MPLLRQVEWDVYAGSKDGRLATAQPDAMADMHAFYRPLGWKTYEMKDWLGTPRLTNSDIKRPDDPTVEKFYYTYKLDYLSATTTYPFGARIDTLSFENPSYLSALRTSFLFFSQYFSLRCSEGGFSL